MEVWDDLGPGRYGVPEPPTGAPVHELDSGDLAVLPGVAFDRRGRRLGRGRGYYDRTFRAAGGPLLVGFAADFQVVEEVPTGPTDRPVDAIVTETGVEWIARREGAAGRDGADGGNGEA